MNHSGLIKQLAVKINLAESHVLSNAMFSAGHAHKEADLQRDAGYRTPCDPVPAVMRHTSYTLRELELAAECGMHNYLPSTSSPSRPSICSKPNSKILQQRRAAPPPLTASRPPCRTPLPRRKSHARKGVRSPIICTNWPRASTVTAQNASGKARGGGWSFTGLRITGAEQRPSVRPTNDSPCCGLGPSGSL